MWKTFCENPSEFIFQIIHTKFLTEIRKFLLQLSTGEETMNTDKRVSVNKLNHEAHSV